MSEMASPGEYPKTRYDRWADAVVARRIIEVQANPAYWQVPEGMENSNEVTG